MEHLAMANEQDESEGVPVLVMLESKVTGVPTAASQFIVNQVIEVPEYGFGGHHGLP